MRQHEHKKLALLFLVCSFLASGNTASIAASPRQLVQNSTQALVNHTQKLVQEVQAFLTAAGRWSPAPQGNDMQLCQALEQFQKKANVLSRDNRGQSFEKVRSELQELEFQTQVLVPLFSQVNAGQSVLAAWMQCRSDLLSISQALSSVPIANPQAFYDRDLAAASGQVLIPSGSGSSFAAPGQDPYFSGQAASPFAAPGVQESYYPQGNPYAPHFSQSAGSPFYPGLAPQNIHITRNSTFDIAGGPQNYADRQNISASGTNHLQSAVLSSLNGADSQTERFVKELSGFLQVKGLWPPPANSTEMQLCQNLQSFQLGLRKFRSDLQANVSYTILQGELQQLGASSQTVDRLLAQASVPTDIVARWNEVRSYMNSTYHAFLSAGSGTHIWTR